MSNLPKSISDLMKSNAYNNSANPKHKSASQKLLDYFREKYPVSMDDGTGRQSNIRKIWVWHTELDKKTCAICESLSGQIYENEEDIPTNPHHENCRCWIEEILADNSNNKVSDEIADRIINNTMREEGGYVDNPNLIDQPTKIGITKESLDNYNKDHSYFNFPSNVEAITLEQAKQIYKEDYYDERRIGEIENERIAGAVFDMGVMSKFSNVGKIVQNTLNESQNSGLKTDGVVGNKTIDALNNIPESGIERFMNSLKENRLNYLQNLPDWEKYKKGWTNRTNRY